MSEKKKRKKEKKLRDNHAILHACAKQVLRFEGEKVARAPPSWVKPVSCVRLA